MILDAFRLDGRVALVTGAARGIGQALACGLAEAGADVMVIDVLPLDDTCARIAALERRCHPLAQNLAEMTAETAHGIVQNCVNALGRLDILVNCAGIIRRKPAIDVTAHEWDGVIDLHLTSTFYLSQAAARHYVERGSGGKIINMASMLSFQGGLGVPAYAAAKSGIAGLTRSLANEWAEYGINVNAIAPGYIATDFTAALRDHPTRAAAILERIPAGEWGEPEALQGAVVFLASDASSYVHGTILPIDGGWLAR